MADAAPWACSAVVRNSEQQQHAACCMQHHEAKHSDLPVTFLRMYSCLLDRESEKGMPSEAELRASKLLCKLETRI